MFKTADRTATRSLAELMASEGERWSECEGGAAAGTEGARGLSRGAFYPMGRSDISTKHFGVPYTSTLGCAN